MAKRFQVIKTDRKESGRTVCAICDTALYGKPLVYVKGVELANRYAQAFEVAPDKFHDFHEGKWTL